VSIEIPVSHALETDALDHEKFNEEGRRLLLIGVASAQQTVYETPAFADMGVQFHKIIFSASLISYRIYRGSRLALTFL
jgi:hypothetical protein